MLDFADSYHDINNIMTLSKTVPEVIEQQGRSGDSKKDTGINNAHIDELQDEVFDILGQTAFTWVALGDDEYSLTDDLNNEIVVSPCKDGYIARLYMKDGEVQYISSEPLPRGYCTGVCEDFARTHMQVSFSDLHGEWPQQSCEVAMTKRQQQFLEKHGLTTQGLSKAETSIKIRRLIAFSRKDERLGFMGEKR